MKFFCYLFLLYLVAAQNNLETKFFCYIRANKVSQEQYQQKKKPVHVKVIKNLPKHLKTSEKTQDQGKTAKPAMSKPDLEKALIPKNLMTNSEEKSGGQDNKETGGTQRLLQSAPEMSIYNYERKHQLEKLKARVENSLTDVPDEVDAFENLPKLFIPFLNDKPINKLLKAKASKDEIEKKQDKTYTLIYIKCQTISWHYYLTETFFLPCNTEQFTIEQEQPGYSEKIAQEDLRTLEENEISFFRPINKVFSHIVQVEIDNKKCRLLIKAGFRAFFGILLLSLF